MLSRILERADVLDFLNDSLTDARFINAISSSIEEEQMFLKNQYGFLFAMDALIKYDIIINDEELIGDYVAQLRRIMKKFSNSDDLSIALNKTIAKVVASKLNLDDTKTPENMKAILEYVYKKYIEEGYIFHAFPAIYIKQIQTTGVDNSETNLEEVKEIDAIFKNHGMGKVFDENLYTHNNRMSITDSPLIAFYNALNMPKYLKEFTSTNDYMTDVKFNRSAFYTKDKVACLSNIKKLCNMAGLTTKEKKKVIDFFNKEWSLYKCDICSPYIMFIKRNAVNKNYLKEYSAILNNSVQEDIAFSLAKVIESRYKHEKMALKVLPTDYRIEKLVGYKKAYFKDEEGFEEIFINTEEDKKIEELSNTDLDLEFANNYGKLTVVALLGIILILLGIILIFLGFYR